MNEKGNMDDMAFDNKYEEVSKEAAVDEATFDDGNISPGGEKELPDGNGVPMAEDEDKSIEERVCGDDEATSVEKIFVNEECSIEEILVHVLCSEVSEVGEDRKSDEFKKAEVAEWVGVVSKGETGEGEVGEDGAGESDNVECNEDMGETAKGEADKRVDMKGEAGEGEAGESDDNKGDDAEDDDGTNGAGKSDDIKGDNGNDEEDGTGEAKVKDPIKDEEASRTEDKVGLLLAKGMRMLEKVVAPVMEVDKVTL